MLFLFHNLELYRRSLSSTTRCVTLDKQLIMYHDKEVFVHAYGTPNSNKLAKYSFTFDKGLPTVNYSLRTANYN